MRCTLCDTNDSMVSTSSPRFGGGTRATWLIGAIVFAVAIGWPLAFSAIASVPREFRAPVGFGVAGAVILLVSLPTLLVLSSAPVWACYACGFCAPRVANPPTPPR